MNLAKDTSVTILPADKGRAVFVMNTTRDSNDYTDKVNNLLNDNKTYHKIKEKEGTQHRAPKNLTITFYRQEISQPHMKVARNSSTTNLRALIPHQFHFMAFLKSTRRTSHSDQL